MNINLDVKELFKQHSALLEGHFQLSSGFHSSMYLQSALVLQHPAVAEQLGMLLGEKIKKIINEKLEYIVSPALGGLIIGHEVARAMKCPFIFTERVNGEMTLRRGFHFPKGARVAVVEDVITTGKSTREVFDVISGLGAEISACAAIIDRSGGEASFSVPLAALLSLDIPTYNQDDCPLCKDNIPAQKPGSRYSIKN